jgi:hypothetical protein
MWFSFLYRKENGMFYFKQDEKGYIEPVDLFPGQLFDGSIAIKEIASCFNAALDIIKGEMEGKRQGNNDNSEAPGGVDMIPTLNECRHPAGDRVYRIEAGSWDIESYGIVHYHPGVTSIPGHSFRPSKKARKQCAEDLANKLLKTIAPRISILVAGHGKATLHIGTIDKEIEDPLDQTQRNTTAVKVNIQKGK